MGKMILFSAQKIDHFLVEKHLIPDLHVIPHHIAGLIVADAVPHFTAVFGEMIDAVNVGFRLH